MIDPSHPEGQSPVQPTCEGEDCPICGRDDCEHAERARVARLRAELAQQKQFGLDRLAQHVKEEQAAQAENATLRAQLSEKEAEIARLVEHVSKWTEESASLSQKLSEKEAEIARLKEDEWRAWGDCRDGKCNACPKCCDAKDAQLAALRKERDEARIAADNASKERWRYANEADALEKQLAESRAAQAKAEQERDAMRVELGTARVNLTGLAAEAERDAARAEAEGLREALRKIAERGCECICDEGCVNDYVGNLHEECLLAGHYICAPHAAEIALQHITAALEPVAQPRPAVEQCGEEIWCDDRSFSYCGNLLPCAEHPTSKEKE